MTERVSGRIAISIVSHVQTDMVSVLLDDLSRVSVTENLEILLTINVPEPSLPSFGGCPFPMRVITNDAPRGFSENHNSAFQRASRDARYFCVLNPDIRVHGNPFPALRSAADSQNAGVVAPLVHTPEGRIADSARQVPTPARLFRRYLRKGGRGKGHLGQPIDTSPEWVAGMFMFMRSSVFRELRGFDEKFHLYLEDVDFCLRARLAGYTVAVVPEAEVIHHAQRHSHRRPQYLLWHLSSLLRFYTSRVFFRYLWHGIPPP